MQDHDRYVGKRGLWRQIQQRRYQLYNREYMAFLATESMSSGTAYTRDGLRAGTAARWEAAAGNPARYDDFEVCGNHPVDTAVMRLLHRSRLLSSC